jgi:hypothetical protein
MARQRQPYGRHISRYWRPAASTARIAV